MSTDLVVHGFALQELLADLVTTAVWHGSRPLRESTKKELLNFLEQIEANTGVQLEPFVREALR